MRRSIASLAALLAAGITGSAWAATGTMALAGIADAASANAPAATPAATVVAQDSGVAVRLRGISAVDAKVAWASGREGTVLRTVDGGAHWQAMHVPGAEKLDFRDVEGFSADRAIVLSIGPGADSRVYRTDDAGRSWQLALQNADPRAFFDCMAFDGERGWMLGDPVDGAFQVYASTDGGRTWALQPGGMPPAEKDEAAFAASGTCIATTPWGGRMVVGGGGAARAFVDSGDGDGNAHDISGATAGASPIAWSAYATPIPARVPAAGIFSAAPAGSDMLLVGGDFEHEAAPGSAALAQRHDDGSLKVSALPDPRGYRSGVACAGDARPRCVAVGPSGVDVLVDGRWQALSDTGYDAVDLAADGSGSGWASGDKGRIARIRIAPAP
jgi:photosystem II stability/assembly factor-like uncharacterized protein